MYFGLERQPNNGGHVINNTTYAVNNVYLNGVRIAAVLPDGRARYYLTDQVDSVKVVVDDSGLPITRFEYLPYGETWFTEEKTGLEEEHNPKFNSQELDKETGYYFYNARHYDPEIGRFVTADNVVDGQYDIQGWNRYMYTHGNPVRYKDPTGHLWQVAVAAVIAVGKAIFDEAISPSGSMVTQEEEDTAIIESRKNRNESQNDNLNLSRFVTKPGTDKIIRNKLSDTATESNLNKVSNKYSQKMFRDPKATIRLDDETLKKVRNNIKSDTTTAISKGKRSGYKRGLGVSTVIDIVLSGISDNIQTEKNKNYLNKSDSVLERYYNSKYEPDSD